MHAKHLNPKNCFLFLDFYVFLKCFLSNSNSEVCKIFHEFRLVLRRFGMGKLPLQLKELNILKLLHYFSLVKLESGVKTLKRVTATIYKLKLIEFIRFVCT